VGPACRVHAWLPHRPHRQLRRRLNLLVQ
jgi:hypothetical protein